MYKGPIHTSSMDICIWSSIYISIQEPCITLYIQGPYIGALFAAPYMGAIYNALYMVALSFYTGLYKVLYIQSPSLYSYPHSFLRCGCRSPDPPLERTGERELHFLINFDCFEFVRFVVGGFTGLQTCFLELLTPEI